MKTHRLTHSQTHTRRESAWLQQTTASLSRMYLAATSDEGHQVPADRKQHQGRVEVDHVGWTSSKRKGMLKGRTTTAEKVPKS